MGDERFYPDEGPVRLASVGDFWIDIHPVTNAQFKAFVDATAYKTFAELPPDPANYRGQSLSTLDAGSAVFIPPPGRVPLNEPGQWWRFVTGANWRNPSGPGSSIAGKMEHPVVQVSFGDAMAYAKWAKKELPTEAEWEYAARGGLSSLQFAWGEELTPEGRVMAKYWAGEFPWKNLHGEGLERTSPVMHYPSNEFGLYDMIGNVWEWTTDWYSDRPALPRKACCGYPRARQARKIESKDPLNPLARVGRRVLKGGSHLCAPNYCNRIRPAARHGQEIDSPASHIGFRCVVRAK